MCGRYAVHSLIGDLQKHFGLFDPIEFSPRFNAAPSQLLPIVRCRNDHRELTLCQWGFVPHWMKTAPKTRPINARAETAADKPFFRAAMRHHRCLIPANGFYEWARTGGGKQPWYFRRTDAEIMAFAGIWDTWSFDGTSANTFAILTTAANDSLRPIHDRMPVILDPDQYGGWMDAGDPALLRPYAGKMSAHAVDRAVNAASNDGPKLLMPVTGSG